MGKSKMKILLIQPVIYNSIDSFIEDSKRMKINSDEPIGLCYISSYIKQQLPEVEIEVYDFHIESLKYMNSFKNNENGFEKLKHYYEFDLKSCIWGLLEQKIEDYKPDIVGISCLYEYNASISLEVAKIVKEIDSNIITVAGGIYATTHLIELNTNINIDYLIDGEGEAKFLHLIYKLITKNKKPSLIDYGGGKALAIVCDKYIENLDELPFPDRSTIPVGEYSIIGRTVVDRVYKENCKVVTVQTDRGCPFMCRYCSGHVISNRDFRHRSVENIVEEIKMLKNQYDIEVFIFNSENAVVNKKWSKELFKTLIDLNIKWVHNGGWYVHLMDEDLIRLAIRSGLIMFNIAIESGSKRLLKILKKNEAIVDCAEQVVNWIRKYSNNIYVTAFFLSGFPFETWEDVDLSMELAKKLDVDWLFWNLFVPYKGSELYQYCLDNGHLKQEIKQKAHYIDSELINTEIDMHELSKVIYDFQLEYNFDNNRSFRIKDYKQSKRDASHVLRITDNKHKKAQILYNKCKGYL